MAPRFHTDPAEAEVAQAVPERDSASADHEHRTAEDHPAPQGDARDDRGAVVDSDLLDRRVRRRDGGIETGRVQDTVAARGDLGQEAVVPGVQQCRQDRHI